MTRRTTMTGRTPVQALRPDDLFGYGMRVLRVGCIRKGRLIVTIDALTQAGYYAGTIDLPADATVPTP